MPTAKVKTKKYRKLAITRVHLPKGALIKRHFHKSDYLVWPVKSGTVRVIVYSSKVSKEIVSDNVKKLNPSKPFYVEVGPQGQWQEVENRGALVILDKMVPCCNGKDYDN